MLLKVSKETVDDLVGKSWLAIQEKIENGQKISSEKTLVFLFAMELVHRVGSELVVDFENRCYENLSGSSKYLDLLFYTDPKYCVALEFKLPRKSSGGASNQPETREAIYRDIARLKYLKKNELKAQACFFLMAANEHAYLNIGKYRRSPKLITSHGHSVDKNNSLNIAGVSLKGLEFKFEWDGIEKINKKYHCKGVFSWLKPIKV